MASGLTLLRQLQSRRRPADSGVACNHPHDDPDKSVNHVGTRAAGVLADVAAATSSTKNAAREMISIEVCLGPDCAVAGGGAALLEIEDLIACASSCKKMNAVAGGCRDRCTEVPNVRILSNGEAVPAYEHSKVNSPDACRKIIRSLELEPIRAHSDKRNDDNPTSVAKLLARRQDAQRWRAHREKAAKERRLQAIARRDSTNNGH